MRKKRSFPSAFKHEQVLKYINNDFSYSDISKEIDVDKSVIRKWVGLYKTKGILGLEISKTKTIFSFDFKYKVVKYMLSNNSSLFDASLKFEVPISSIFQWQKNFANFGLKGLYPKCKGRPKSMSDYKRKKRKSDKPLTREEELLLENESLRCQLDILKKLQALIQAEEKAKKHKS
ncbi:transposase [Flavobacterium macrobrachii]|jgi:transposase|uniref:transposase n=1 Tax=Flavobacterium macrobrachii TaxID=591204 RepID=UPI0019A40772